MELPLVQKSLIARVTPALAGVQNHRPAMETFSGFRHAPE